ncbi:hypothetical protein [Empedobacter tilapiae]
MDLENLISMIKDSEYTSKIIQMGVITVWKLFEKFLIEKLENQSTKRFQPKSLKEKEKRKKRSNIYLLKILQKLL